VFLSLQQIHPEGPRNDRSISVTRHLQPVDGMFGPAVVGALQNVPVTEADKATVLLARRYAEAIDTAEDRDQALAVFGPKLLAVLAELRATPKARGAGKPEQPRAGRLSALREARVS
jgi:hypothetical protein